MTAAIGTADLYDEYEEQLQSCDLQLRQYGGRRTFAGHVVNGRLVALSTKLVQGDKVEVLTSKAQGAGPSRYWLGFVVSSRARQNIRQYFSRERRDEAIEQGKETLAKDLRRTGIPLQRLLTLENLTAVANDRDS